MIVVEVFLLIFVFIVIEDLLGIELFVLVFVLGEIDVIGGLGVGGFLKLGFVV